MNVIVQNRKEKTKSKRPNYKNRLNFKIIDDDNQDRIINQKVLNKINKTLGNNTTISSTDGHVVLALTEGRLKAKGEVGIAVINVNSPSLILCQISDDLHYSDTLTKIQIMNPTKILLPDTIFELTTTSKIVQMLNDYFPSVQLIPVQRRHFNDKFGLEQLTNLSSRMSTNILEVISNKYYCLSAAAALLEYLKKIHFMKFADNCLKIEYQPKHHGILIDFNTSVRLELIYSLSNELTAIKQFSLFNLLNFCVTKIGQRHLRANILEPSCNIEFIRNRQEQIKVLLENEEVAAELKEKLEVFRSVDQTLKIACITPSDDCEKAIETNIQLAILLKRTLEGVKPLAETVEKTVSESFELQRQILSSKMCEEIIKKIDEVLEPDVHQNKLAAKYIQNLYAVKTGYDETIDRHRESYKECFSRVQEYFADLTEHHKLPLKLIYSDKYGHHILIKNPNNFQLPDEFDIIYRKGVNQYLTTSALAAMNEKMRTLKYDIIRVSNMILSQMLISIASNIEMIHHLISVVIDLDIVQSLAEASNRENFCCPSFGKIMMLKATFHPMLEMSRNKQDVVTNNVAATPQFNFFLIEGPNMSGKTIFLKMIAIVQIMSQIGCFVPGIEAQVRLVDRIFSRIGFQDNMEQNASSFTVELREMEYIYSNLTPNSLVIIDELCRSTNPQEGEKICYKYCENLLNFIGLSNDNYFTDLQNDSMDETHDQSINSLRFRDFKLKDIARPFIFLTTHFTSLHCLAETFQNLIFMHMLAVEKIVDDKPRLEYTYKSRSGRSNIQNYGLAAARCLRFPTTLIDRAEVLIDQVKEEPSINLDETRRTLRSIQNRTLGLNTTIVSDEMTEILPEILNLYSTILQLMSDPRKKDNKTGIDDVNAKLVALHGKLSDDFKTLIADSSVSQIINALNATIKSTTTD